jgi:hypothetical protein
MMLLLFPLIRNQPILSILLKLTKKVIMLNNKRNWRDIPTTTKTTTTTTTSTTTRTTTSLRTTTPRTSSTSTRTTAMRTTTFRRPDPTTAQITAEENVKVICSKSKPPLRTNKTDAYKYIGSKVLCFWINSEIELLCDLCKDNCLDPNNECPSDFCDCRWYL